MSEIIIFNTTDNQTTVEVRFEGETFWLNQYQLADLFLTDRTAILKHLQNIYATGELSETATCAKFAQAREEGKRAVKREVLHYKSGGQNIDGQTGDKLDKRLKTSTFYG